MADAAGAASGDDSGLIDLKAMSAAEEGAKTPVAQDTVKTLPPGPMSAPAAEAAMAAALAPASATLPDMAPARETPVPETKASPSHAPAAVSAVAQSKVAVAETPATAKSESSKKGAPLALLLGGGAALVAIAAGAFVMLRPAAEPKMDAPAPVAVAAKPVEVPAAKPVEAPAPKIETPAPEPAPVAVDDSLAKAPVAAKPQAPVVANGGASKAVAAAPAAAPKAEPKAAPEHVDPKLVVKDAPPTSASAGALSDAMRQAAGPSNDQPQAAGGSADPGAAPGSVPQRPSQGAVTGALGAVLPSARACLGPDDPVSKASITFGSSGSVQSVIISGFVAGKPAEACVREALMKAKVPAFAQPTFPANVTIRP
ncbi:MAG: hypothetical protein U0169_11965 [Polyangiaceae bacterium]